MNSLPRISEQAWNTTRAFLLSDGFKNQVSILPTYGGLLLYWKYEGIDLIETFKTEDELLQVLKFTYPNCKLSPFVCRVNQGQYYWKNQSYQIEPIQPDGHALHGWMYNREFILKERIETAETAKLVLCASYNNEYIFYPFSFEMIITYTLSRLGELEITTQYVNTGDAPMPLVDGWHPYFRTSESVNRSYLRADIDSYLEADHLIPTGKIIDDPIFFTGQHIGDTHWDTCFLWKHQGKAQLTTSLGTINLENVNGYDYLQVFTPPHRKSIALEPLSGAPDAWNNQIGLISLEPKEIRQFTIRMNFNSEKTIEPDLS